MEAPDKKSWSIPNSSDRIGFNDSGVFLHKDWAMADMDAHGGVWGFPKMVVPNNYWFCYFTKHDHFGMFWGVPSF